MLLPPTNDVPDASVGWWATVHVSGSAPASVTMPIIHGPLMNAADGAVGELGLDGHVGHRRLGEPVLEERVVERQRVDAGLASRA